MSIVDDNIHKLIALKVLVIERQTTPLRLHFHPASR